MRLVHVVPSLSPQWGGLSRAVAHLCQAIANRGHEVEIVTTVAQREDSLNPSGTRVHAVPVHFGARWRYALGLRQTVTRVIQAADVVHLHGLWLYPQLVASRIACRVARPYVVSPHGMLDDWALKQRGLRKRLYGRLFEWQTLSRSAALHALTDDEASSLEGLNFGVPVFTVPNGIDVQEFSARPERNAFTVRYPELKGKILLLFLGRLHYKKGVEMLIRAFGEIGAARTEVALVIAGPGSQRYRRHLESIVGDQRTGRCIFTGMLNRQETLEALAAADIFILPSYSEALPLAALEALAMGVPAIVSTQCHLARVEQDGAGLVVEPELSAVHRAILRLVDDPVGRVQMGMKGRQLVFDHYTWDSVAAQMVDAYRRIAGGRRRPDRIPGC